MNKFTKTIFSVLCAITLLSLPIIVAHAEETQAQEDSQDDFLVDPASGYAVQSKDIDNGDTNNEDNGNENDATQDTQTDNTNNAGNGQSEVVEVSSDTGNAVTSPETVTPPSDNTATAPTSAPSSNPESAPSSNAAPATSSSSDSGGSTGGGTVSAEQAQFSNSATMPGHALYRLKLWWESAQEKFTSDNVKLLTLKQEHLQNRINELKYDANYNNNKNTNNLLQKIQISRIEVDDMLQKIKTNYQGGYIVQKVKGTQVLTKTEDYIAKAQRTNDKILTNILNDPTLSKNARKNVKDAIIKIGLMKKVKANLVQGKSGDSKSVASKGTTALPSVAASKKTTTQGTAGKVAPTPTARKKIKTYRMKASMVQGSFDASPKALSLMPFKSAMVYEPTEQKWYSIVVFSDRITISAATLDHPDMYLYPSGKQMDKLSKIIAGINKRGTITSKDKIELTLLWYQIGKREVR